MSEDANIEDMSEYMIDVKISIFNRIRQAIQTSVSLGANALTDFLLAPVEFARIIHVKTQRIIDVSQLPKDHPIWKQINGEANVIQHEHKVIDNDEEPWMKEHKNIHGDE